MSINKHTPQSRLLILLLILALIITNFIQTPFTAQAAGDDVSVTVDSMSMDFGSSGSRFKGGVTYARTGYLCYLVKADGGLIDGMKAKAFRCDNFNALGGEVWGLKSKKGDYGKEITSWTGEAPWGYPCFNEDASSNESKIKDWMTAPDPATGKENGRQFVYKYWGADIGEKFYKGDYVLVLENILSFQPATVQKVTEADIRSGRYKLAIRLTVTIWGTDCRMVAYGNAVNKISRDTVMKAILKTEKGKELYKDKELFESTVNATVTAANSLISSDVNKAIKDFVGDGSEGIKTGKGSPVIGTLAECIKYEKTVGGDPSIFASYTNRVACFSEYISRDGAGRRAGFTPWIKPVPQKPDKLTDDEVASFGVGMMVILAKDTPSSDLQTTCDEPEQPEPHNPPDESEGSFKIVKSYRTRNMTTNILTDKGNYIKEDSDYNIEIEEEDEWTLIGWKTSTEYNKNIKSTEWETTVPPTHIQQGTGTKVIEMKSPETTLYILFEKTESDGTPVTGDADFIISQSTITRKIKVSFPDTKNTEKYVSGEKLMKNVYFEWRRPKHSECSGNHKCSGCKDGTKDDGTTYKYCDGHKCSGWKWKSGEPCVTFSLKNTKKSDYPDILATKSGWEAVADTGLSSISQRPRTYNTTAGWLAATKEDYWKPNGWDYACVLLRGKDKLALAKWKNTDLNVSDANTDLATVSSSGFKIDDKNDANSRKKSLYFEKFNIAIADDSSDLKTVWLPTVPNHGICNENVQSFSLKTNYSTDISVKVETYSGSAGSTIVDTTYNSNPTNKGKFNHSGDFSIKALGTLLGNRDKIQGVEVPSGATIKFRPYIQMNYDLQNFTHKIYGEDNKTEPKKAYVLGDIDREMAPNDYAEVSWKSTGSIPNLTLNSL